MLVLTQNVGESIFIFDKDGKEIVKIVYIKKQINGSQISIGFVADKEIVILREKALKKRKINGNIRNTDEPIFFIEENQEDNYDEL